MYIFLQKIKKIVSHASFFKLAFIVIFCVVALKHIPSSEKNKNSASKFIPIVMKLSSNEFTPSLKISGFTKTIDQGIVSSKIQAVVKKIHIKQGHKVTKNTLLVTLHSLEIENNLSAAKSNFEHKVAEFKAAQKLNQKKFYSENSLLAAKADLDKAQADLQKAENEAADLHITATADGYLEECFVNTGDTVFPRDKLVKFISDSATQIRAYVSEDNIVKLKDGMKAKVTANGKEFEATVSGIAAIADPQTRNFYIDLSLPENTDISQFGITVQVDVFLKPSKGFWINSSALTLNDEGELGVKVLNTDNTVSFQPVSFWQLSKEGAYIESNSEFLDIIIYGGEFLNIGQKVLNIHRQEIPSL